MKWLSVLTVCAVAFLSNACEMHKKSELVEESHGGEAHAAPAAEHEEAKPAAEEGKPGEAPKFFPDKK
jgi:hypothetical protein